MKNVKASIYGYIIGDAMGLPLKNKTRKELLKKPAKGRLCKDGYQKTEKTKK